jgi:hypothetical protein
MNTVAAGHVETAPCALIQVFLATEEESYSYLHPCSSVFIGGSSSDIYVGYPRTAGYALICGKLL